MCSRSQTAAMKFGLTALRSPFCSVEGNPAIDGRSVLRLVRSNEWMPPTPYWRSWSSKVRSTQLRLREISVPKPSFLIRSSGLYGSGIVAFANTAGSRAGTRPGRYSTISSRQGLRRRERSTTCSSHALPAIARSGTITPRSCSVNNSNSGGQARLDRAWSTATGKRPRLRYDDSVLDAISVSFVTVCQLRLVVTIPSAASRPFGMKTAPVSLFG